MRALASVLVAVLGAPAVAVAQTAEADLAAGMRQVDEGDYAQAVITLDRAARALAAQKDRTRDLGNAYLYLGIAYLGLGSETTAKARFRDALGQVRDLALSPEQFPPKVIELFEKARDESRQEPATPPAAAEAPKARKGRSKAPLILIGAGGAAAAGIAVAASGGSADAGATDNRATETITGAVSGTCGSDTVSHRFVPTSSGTLDALLSWAERDRVLSMYLGDTNNTPSSQALAQSSPASNTSARLTAPVSNRTYWVYVSQRGGGPCVSYTLALTYPH
jgi:tetratricopeptide (TPR) repeat protein